MASDDGSRPVLRAEGLAFTYPQEPLQEGYTRGLLPISLDLAQGEILHVSSPSGGGKSTALRSGRIGRISADALSGPEGSLVTHEP